MASFTGLFRKASRLPECLRHNGSSTMTRFGRSSCTCGICLQKEVLANRRRMEGLGRRKARIERFIRPPQLGWPQRWTERLQRMRPQWCSGSHAHIPDRESGEDDPYS
jgi:hypothetical protein